MSRRNLYLTAAIACMTGALFGYSVGFIGGILVLPSFEHHFQLDLLPPQDVATTRSTIVSSWLVGCVIGVPLGVPVCSKLGRKSCISFSACLYVFGAIIQLIDSDYLLLFELGRFLNGIGVGVGTLVSPLYISEVSPPSDRGALMSGYQVAIQVFALIGFWGAFISDAVFPTTSNWEWRLPVLLQLVPGSILLAGSLFILPESPRWLAINHSAEHVAKALSWLRMSNENSVEILAEADDIHQLAMLNKRLRNSQESSFLDRVTHNPVRKRILIGIGLMIAQNAVGLNALNYYCPIIFMSAGFTSVSASLFLTGFFGVVKMVAALLFMFVFVRQRGNRFWLLLGTAIMTVAMLILAYCVSTLPAPSSDATFFPVKGLISVLMVYVFAFAFGISLGPISWNVCAEIFPADINTQACAVTTCVQWLSQIAIAAITPPLITAIGGGTYLVYGIFCVLSFVWCAICVPETRGVALGPSMDAVFGQASKNSMEPSFDHIERAFDESTPLLTNQRRRSSMTLNV